MSSFTSPLWVTPLENGRDWRLIRPFTYHLGSKESRRLIKVPRNFVTDFASVPRIFFFLPDWATYSKAPVLHDRLYEYKYIFGEGVITRRRADDVFLEAMLIDFRYHKFGKLVATLEYIAVRLFGWLAW